MEDRTYLDALATEIGFRIEAGDLPPQDEFGRYIMDASAASVAVSILP